MSTAPNLSSFLASLRNHKADVSVEHLESLFRRRQIFGARRCAVATAHILITVVAEHKPKDAADLLHRVRLVGHGLTSALSNEPVIGNIIRRVLGLIREASEPSKKDELSGSTQNGPGAKVPISNVKEDVLDGMRELLDELDQADKQISEYATDQIHPNDTILVHGYSLAIQRFLLDASKRRRFTVVQVEGYPNQHRAVQDMVMNGAIRDAEEEFSSENRLKRLTTAGIDVVYLSDSAVFAVMPRVNKVILSAQALYSNGGCTASAGAKMIAKAASFHKAPVLVLGAIYRLCPSFPFEVESSTKESGPNNAIPFADGDFLADTEVINGTQDYLEPNQTNLIITNIGGFSPAFMGRIAADHYREQDIEH